MKKQTTASLMILVFMAFSLSMGTVLVQAQTSPILKVGVSIAPLAGIVEAVGGPYVETFVILPEGTEPHSAQLPTQAVIDAQSADLMVLTGHFPWEEDLVSQVSKPFITMENESALARYRDYGAELSPLPGQENLHNASTQGNTHNENPHGWWLLPSNAIAIANATRAAFTILNSTYEDYWQSSFDVFVEHVIAFENLVVSTDNDYHFSDLKAVVVSPAEAYVAETFGIDAVAYLQGESVQISGNQLLAVQDALRNGSVQLIIGSDVAKLQTSGTFAMQLVEDYGGTLIWVKAISSEGFSSYVSLMTYNLGSLISGIERNPNSGVASISILFWIGATGVLAVIVVIESVILIQRARAE